MRKPRTSIFLCKTYVIQARYVWQRWQHRTLLDRLLGRSRWVEGWVCTKCGQRRAMRRVR